MSVHTPGPWMVLPSVDRGQFCILTALGNRIDVAVTYGFEHTPREANARLIAAAPDLLEALKYAICALEVCGKDFDYTLSRANAAISKATGEQS